MINELLQFIVRKRVMMGFLFCVCYLLFLSPGDTLFVTAGFILVGLGELMRIWASLQLRKIEFLAKEGIYSATRNPLYFGSFIIGLGFVVMTYSNDAFALQMLFTIVYLALFPYLYIMTIKNEEIALLEKFGEEYKKYCAGTSRFVPMCLPGGLGPLDIKRLFINKEYKTILGILLIIAVLFIK